MAKKTTVRYEEIPVDKLTPHENLKEIDNELVKFMTEIYGTNINSMWAEPTIQNALSFLDSLCSVKFEILGRNDQKTIEKVLEFVLKKSTERINELKRGI